MDALVFRTSVDGSFSLNLGDNPQIGNTVPLDVNLEVAGFPVHINGARLQEEAVELGDGKSDRLTALEFSTKGLPPSASFAQVLAWVAGNAESDWFLSILTTGEIMRGIERLPESHRKTVLQSWLNNKPWGCFGERLIDINVNVMITWGAQVARLDRADRKLPFADSLIASTTLRHNLILVTRNEANFKDTGVQIINPWH